MPQIGFQCPDKENILFKDCINKCRMGERCISKPHLKSMIEQRLWNGKISTTQALNGTRFEFLRNFKDYFIDPQEEAFSSLGTLFHGIFEGNEIYSELTIEDKNTTGTLDYYDPDEFCLWDYKLCGAYAVKKALGLTKRKIIDPSGAVYKRSGKEFKAGDPKMIDEWYFNSNKRDCFEWDMQLNKYRINLEKKHLRIDKMKIEATIRDGGLNATVRNNIDRKIYIIEIPKLKNKYVIDYYNKKSKALKIAVAHGYAPMCNERERWLNDQGENVKCERFCQVSKHCKEMGINFELDKKFNLPISI